VPILVELSTWQLAWLGAWLLVGIVGLAFATNTRAASPETVRVAWATSAACASLGLVLGSPWLTAGVAWLAMSPWLSRTRLIHGHVQADGDASVAVLGGFVLPALQLLAMGLALVGVYRAALLIPSRVPWLAWLLLGMVAVHAADEAMRRSGRGWFRRYLADTNGYQQVSGAMGLTGNPVAMAAIGVLSIPVAWELGGWATLAIPALVLLVVSSRSRMALPTVAVVCAVVWWPSAGVTSAALSIPAALALLVGPSAIRRNWSPLGDPKLPIWAATAASVLRYPWLGLGLGGWWPIVGSGLGSTDGRIRWGHAHCEPLQVASEAGLPCLALVLGGLGTLIWRLVNAGDAVGVAGLIGLGLLSLTSFPIRTPAVMPWAAYAVARAVGA